MRQRPLLKGRMLHARIGDEEALMLRQVNDFLGVRADAEGVRRCIRIAATLLQEQEQGAKIIARKAEDEVEFRFV